MQQLRPAARLGALLALGALLLSGCAAQTPAHEVAGCPDVAIADLDIGVAAKDIKGTSTACLANPVIDPIDNPGTPALPATVTDDSGTEVTVTDVSRILALDISGTLAATVWGLGLGENLVGRDAATQFPGTEDLEIATGASHTLNAEAILALEPTVLFLDGSLGPKAVRQQLAEAGIPVVMITQDRTIDNISEIVDSVAAALGLSETGTRLDTRIAQELAASQAEIDKIVPTAEADRPRVVFLYARGGAGIYYLFGEGSGADALIRSIGGVDVAEEIGWTGMKPMTAEALLDSRPDVLLMMTDGLESVGGVDGLLEQIPALQQTPAGLNRRIVDMDGTEILGFGPRTPRIIEALARALYTEPAAGNE
ncbi:heme/hemin ABC transporter substrate-binding protein [Mycetocola spongiae]|uniref:heme/hemin ABC transporter substrate-binding protein n=1 Tax=Mycetocola spongiae TaxID=2859226 RepID=UPI001CF23939|nr:ABC transporter substrate-binding protein [Mycetocola spongiae]UCR88440.1 ABC transporter substrate-binding protein [Mycetocola spongiae]